MDHETKNKRLMNIYKECKQHSKKISGSNLYSLKNVLKDLSKSKKTPSTSLHTTASKRHQQSQQTKTNQPQSPQTSYRSRLQLTKRNLWIDLINQQSQQYIQADQITITEYRTNTQVNSMIVSDWKQPYHNIEQIYQKSAFDQTKEIEGFHHWKEIMVKKVQNKISS